ncbi:MAG: hypothetical protein JWM89_2232 [Acidimicrobiales bacterium]|nr:hypothetical protein [Acidimicrobiales bacterium]
MPAPDSTDATTADHLAMLASADLVIEGRMPWSSNATFLCELWPGGSRPDAGVADQITEDAGEPDDAGVDPDEWDEDWDEADEGDEAEEPDRAHDLDGRSKPPTRLPGTGGPLGRAIYKPHQGERPLWDFPDGLYRREAGAFQLASALGWDCIPPTIVRDGPFGPGSVQLFIDADFDQHHFTLVEDEANHPQLRRMCAFDIVANSTDRKGGHVLVDPAGHLWGIDNGLCLHAEFKLRTVIWEFALEPLPAELADDLAAFVEAPLPDDLCAILDPFERDALHQRARALLAEGRFPTDPTGRRYPWPLV